jgi:hypothetical protein
MEMVTNTFWRASEGKENTVEIADFVLVRV